jgi:hypothetical protein
MVDTFQVGRNLGGGGSGSFPMFEEEKVGSETIDMVHQMFT